MSTLLETPTFNDVAECTDVAACGFEGADEVPGVTVVDSLGGETFCWTCPECGLGNETYLGEFESDPDDARDRAMGW
jgi:hypothetical protein